MSENQFLQSFFAVSASAVLVSGTLLLLSSTAPWNPPQLADGDPSTPDSASLSPEATASIDIEVPQAPLASDQADTAEFTEPDMAAADAEPEMPAQAEAEEPSVPALPEATSPEVEAVAALGTPLSPESADVSLDGSGADAPVAVQAEATSEVGVASDAPAEIAVSVPLAEVADLRRDTATDQIAGMLAALPPRPITSDKSEAASTEVATVLAAEPPAPPSPSRKRCHRGRNREGGHGTGRLTTCTRARACPGRCTLSSAKGRRGRCCPATLAAPETCRATARAESGGSSGGAASRSREAGIGEAECRATEASRCSTRDRTASQRLRALAGDGACPGRQADA